MMGIMVGIGMVVDNTIVVVENIYRRHTDGLPPRRAAISGASEVSLAIIMATLTTVVVFLPLMIMSSDVDLSFFLSRIGVPVMVALLGSLFVALIFIPLATVKFGGRHIKSDPQSIKKMRTRYRSELVWTLHHRRDAFVVTIALMITVFFPYSEVRHTDSLRGTSSDLRFNVYTPGFFTMEDTNFLADEFEAFLDTRRKEYGIETIRVNYWKTRLSIHVFLEDEPNTEWWYVAYHNFRRSIGYPIDNKMSRQAIIERHARTHAALCWGAHFYGFRSRSQRSQCLSLSLRRRCRNPGFTHQ